MIKVIITGTVFKKENQEKVTTLCINSSEKYKGEWQNEYIYVKCFGKTKELVDQFVHEGTAIYVEANQSTSEHNEKRYSNWIMEKFHYLPKTKTETQKFNDKVAEKKKESEEEDDDDLPF